VSPRALKDSVRPRLQSGASVRPLNFTVRSRMTRLALLSVVLAVICLGAVAAHTPLIATSLKVGWDHSGNSIRELKVELHNLKDPDALRLAAETSASLEQRSLESNARYVVYFYSALAALGIALAVIGYLARSASNNRWRGP